MFQMVCVDNGKDYYKILGVSKKASQDDLKKAHREAAVKNHPDKGGDPGKFKEITQAYGVLRDPWNRWKYDRFGEDALMGGGHRTLQILYVHILINTVAGFDVKLFCKGIIDRFSISLDQDIVGPLKVSLEDLYYGLCLNLPFTRYIRCNKCNGQGSGASVKCSGCQGSGMKAVSIGDLGPSTCNECKGTGQTIDYLNRCQLCMGLQAFPVSKVVYVHVEKGMQSGQKIPIPKETLGTHIGAAFILEQQEHPKFKRKGDDLFVEHTLSLTEALCGYQFELTHLDKRKLIIKSQPGEVVNSGQLKEIKGEGMPLYKRPWTRGKLYIHFTVDLPTVPRDCFSSTTDMEVEPATSPRGSGHFPQQ